MNDATEQFKAIVARANKSTEKYYGWIRQMLTLCTGSLTLLVALHKSFVPDIPTFSWLLQITWIGLGVSIVLAATILHGESVHLHNRAQIEMKAFLKQIETSKNKLEVTATQGPWRYEIAARMFPWSLSVSLVALVCFALANI